MTTTKLSSKSSLQRSHAQKNSYRLVNSFTMLDYRVPMHLQVLWTRNHTIEKADPKLKNKLLCYDYSHVSLS